jgi:protein TonB
MNAQMLSPSSQSTHCPGANTYRNHGARLVQDGVGEGRWQGMLIVIAMHLGMIAALMSYQPAREAIAAAMPIMVNLITPPQPLPLKEKPKPVLQPAPKPHQPELPPLIVATPVEAPAAPYIAPPPPEPPKVVAPVTVAAAPVQAAPLPVIPPRFDAAYLDNPAPEYPAASKRLREQGKVLLRVLVAPGGTAERIEVRASSGSARLDDTALATVKRWRFVPAKQGAEAVAAWVLVPISFALKG